MNRQELQLAILTATNLINQHEVLIIGSQSILGSYDEDDLPSRATASQEIDIAPLEDDETESLATLIDAGAGEWSPFDSLHGFYIQGVSVKTAFLPKGWLERVVKVTAGPQSYGLCLEPHDLCAAKLARGDQKDKEFVHALVKALLVDKSTIAQRIEEITDSRFSRVAKSSALELALSL